MAATGLSNLCIVVISSLFMPIIDDYVRQIGCTRTQSPRGEILNFLRNAGHSKDVTYKSSFKDMDTGMSSAKQPSTKAMAANKIQAESADFNIYNRRSQAQ